MKRSWILGIAGGALALTLVGGAAAASANYQLPTAFTQTTATAVPSQPGQPATGAQHKGIGARRGAMGFLKIVADQTKQTPQQVLAELRAGKTLAQIAQEHGSSSDAVIAAARSALQQRLAKAVQSGKLTQDKADARLARFDKQAPKIMNSTKIGMFVGRAGMEQRGLARSLGRALATQAKLTPQQVMTEARAGKTLAQIAQEHGVTNDAVIAAARATLQQHLATAVQNSKMTQAQADQLLALFDKNAPDAMNKTFTPGKKAPTAQPNA